MMTAVTETSIDNYYANTAHFDGIKADILAILKPGVTYTRREISVLVGIDHSCASGRVNELVEAKELIECGTAPRGYKNKYVGLVRLRDAGDAQ